MRYIQIRRGTSLIDLVISMGIIAVLFGGIYLVYFSIITAVSNVNVRAAATTAVSQTLETIRNLPYANIGTVGGAPAGIIPQTQTVTVSGYSFSLATTIRNIDDPFDGTLGGNPDDLAPADYKLVSIDASCPLCDNAIDVEITTTVAPKALESATQNGSLFVNAIDANGNPLQGASVHVVNASVTPSINITDTTNASGILELVGVPTSTLNYAIAVTEPGYSTDMTYPPGAAGNPNPVKPNATVAVQTVTNATFAIDRLAALTVLTSDNRCVPIGSESFSLQGSKLIGTNPNVLKFSTSSATSATGTKIFPALEWDAYSLQSTDAAEDLAGTIPLNPIAVDPGSSAYFRFVLQPAADPALLVNVVDAVTGDGITNAVATLSKSGFSNTLTTGHSTLSQTDWSGSGSTGYASQSGGIDTASIPGAITLLLNASGTYDTGVTSSLISNTFDVGGSSSTFYSINWDPASQPPQTGAGSLALQVAANNDNATWNFVGPDGTANTYFTSPGTLPASLSADRYFRYQVFMSTANKNAAPELDDVAFDFSADCVPPAQVLFAGLPQGTYTLDATAQNYAENSSTVVVGSGFQSSTILLTHL